MESQQAVGPADVGHSHGGPRIRYVLAWDHALCRTVVGVYLRAVLGWLRAQARRRGVAAGRGGAVAVVQRFGAALNLNVHIHALAMDGVYAADGAGGVRFHPRECADDDVGPLLATIRRRIEALLIRRGVADGNEGFDAPDRWAEEAPALAGLAAASVRGVAALGARAGTPVRRWGDAIDAPDPAATDARWQGGAGTAPTLDGRHDPTALRGVRPMNRSWAELMQRSFGFDVLACPRCPGRLKLVALIRDPAVIQRILRHLRLPENPPVMRPARAPPLPFDDGDQRVPIHDH